MVVIGCETDFVARTDDFKKLCREVAMQVCSFDFKTVEELYDSEYIRDSSKKIQDIVNEVAAKTGEKIEIKKFVKFSVGD
jgi:elongation factor Ts